MGYILILNRLEGIQQSYAFCPCQQSFASFAFITSVQDVAIYKKNIFHKLINPHLHLESGAQEVLPCKGWGVTASQLDLSSLTPLSVAGCGRLQL